VLQLPTDAIPLLIQAVESRASVVGVCAARRTAATACNVECEVVGSDPASAHAIFCVAWGTSTDGLAVF
jgi:hypothetical protein